MQDTGSLGMVHWVYYSWKIKRTKQGGRVRKATVELVGRSPGWGSPP